VLRAPLTDVDLVEGPVTTGAAVARPGVTTISVMVVDPQALFRSGLVRLLEDDDRVEVVAVASGGRDALEMCAALPVDVMVSDLDLASMDGIGLIEAVRAVSPRTRVLILTAQADARVTPAIVAGAGGFMLKDAEPEAIRSAVVAVHLGEHVLCPEATHRLLDDPPSRQRHLTARETEVLRLLARGSRNGDIAAQLHISDRTVRNYVSRLYRKLAMANRDEVTSYALRTGIAYRPGSDGPGVGS